MANLSEERNDRDVRNIPVGHDVDLAFQVSQDRRSERHPLDNAHEVADLHDIADAELIFKQNEET